jgi:hypothetical protein
MQPALTCKQILFRDFLIQRLGFIKDKFLDLYLKTLELSAHKFNKKNTIINHLTFEIKAKGEAQYNPKNNNLISATDISNYTYCPVSYSISKTFNLPKIESAAHGTYLHEKHRIINYLTSIEATRANNFPFKISNPFLNESNKSFFEDLNDSTLIYYSQDKNYFIKGDYVGQPDYILKNTHHYIVEEKFQYQNREERHINSFYDNHINQVASYIYGIPDYNLAYGYLVYWKYYFDNGRPIIHTCYVTKIEKSNETLKNLKTAYINLKKFNTNKLQPFNITTRNPGKCANCISNLLCGHKTGRFDQLSIPYSQEYMKTYFAAFPKELKPND